MQFDKKNCYEDIGSKAFFTMATLLMPLLGNELIMLRYVMCEKSIFLPHEIMLKRTYVQCSQYYGAVQVLQEVFGLLSSTLTEAKDFIAKCHFGISLAITLPVMVIQIVKFSRKGYKIRYRTRAIITCS